MSNSRQGSIVVTEMEAARRQLRTAIRLWLNDGDPVSIQTLAYASHEIIHRHYRNAGFSGLLYDSSQMPTDTKEREATMKALHGPALYFKHGTRGQKPKNRVDSVEFFLSANTMYLCMSLFALDKLGTKFNLDEFTAIHWLAIRYPSSVLAAKLGEHGVPVDDALAKFHALTRAQFAASFQEATKQRIKENGPFPGLEVGLITGAGLYIRFHTFSSI